MQNTQNKLSLGNKHAHKIENNRNN